MTKTQNKEGPFFARNKDSVGFQRLLLQEEQCLWGEGEQYRSLEGVCFLSFALIMFALLIGSAPSLFRVCHVETSGCDGHSKAGGKYYKHEKSKEICVLASNPQVFNKECNLF